MFTFLITHSDAKSKHNTMAIKPYTYIAIQAIVLPNQVQEDIQCWKSEMSIDFRNKVVQHT